MLYLAIIGAGPYGLSLAAHAKDVGLNYKVFGYPMDFWKSKMPPNMFIRTLLEYTGLSDPNNKFTLNHYQREKREIFSYPLPRSVFVKYGLWFTEQLAISIEKTLITQVSLDKGLFKLESQDGIEFIARKVIVAVGLTNAQYIPPKLSEFPEHLVSHTSKYTAFDQFEGKDVLVLGGGQSAWEAAALLHQSNANVQLVYRRPHRLSPDKNTNAKQQALASRFYTYSKEKQQDIRKNFVKPTVSDFLVPFVEGKVKQKSNTSVIDAVRTKDGRLKVVFNDHSSLVIDHLIAATGYKFSPERLPFLKRVKEHILLNPSGSPKVNEHFESTLPNLYFSGPSTSYNHGPTFNFIADVKRTANVIINHLASAKG